MLAFHFIQTLLETFETGIDGLGRGLRDKNGCRSKCREGGPEGDACRMGVLFEFD